MVRTSVPDSSRCTAKAWRSECGVTGLDRPENRCAFWQAFDGFSRDRLTWMSTRKQPLLRMCGLPVGTQNLQELRRQHHVPILAALALIDPDDHPLAIDSAGLQTNSFRYTQASS